MQTEVQEIYTKNILPLPDRAKLEIAALILEDVTGKTANGKNTAEPEITTDEPVYALTLIANLAIDVGVDDLAERHDFYAHGRLED
ncbi:MAG TPA: hypothetical protein PKY59_20080 [Pyrinomonadaceae bacterium]|nr:hypothetical protein [Pyrinomonadaceae bacterium]